MPSLPLPRFDVTHAPITLPTSARQTVPFAVGMRHAPNRGWLRTVLPAPSSLPADNPAPTAEMSYGSSSGAGRTYGEPRRRASTQLDWTGLRAARQLDDPLPLRTPGARRVGECADGEGAVEDRGVKRGLGDQAHGVLDGRTRSS